MNLTILKDLGVAELNVTLVVWAVSLALRQLRRSAAAGNGPGLFLAALSFLQSLTCNPTQIFLL